MSNAQVGNVYQQIILDVIEASRVDVEEGGVDEGVLEELKKGWQKKLSQQQLAAFPWDPKPEPPPTPAVQAPVSQPPPAASPPQPISNGGGYSQPQAQVTQGLTMPMPGGQSANDPQVKPEPGVKIEPGLENAPAVPQAGQQGGPIAQQRVIAQLQHQYGERAAASIDKLRAQPPNGAQPQGQQRPGNQPAPQAYPGQYQGNPQQYRPNMPVNPSSQQQRPPMPNGQRPAPSQMDGAGDDEGHVGVLLHQGPDGQSTEMGRVEIDNLLHAQIAARARAMEGGGLMVPLKRASKGKSVSYHRTPGPNEGPSRFDGPDDDLEESDEDAINSDLDDPDDNLEENDEDDDAGQIMLCMYDKVQRVKNKWKCVLKDGVLNVNGKDYVFHKATGEYEW
ncbi:transcription factor IIA, alpha/beta subunit [Biscogniauxia sp. FL1348]|nr:transcription factor IIA, alpha/beta subunit [Biscogniauxia sp. FL1348]